MTNKYLEFLAKQSELAFKYSDYQQFRMFEVLYQLNVKKWGN